MNFYKILFFLLFLLANIISGQNYNVSDNTFIQNWLVAGPFPNPLDESGESDGSGLLGFKYDFLKSIGGEENAVFYAAQKIKYVDFDNNDKTVIVQPAKTNANGILSFDGIFPDQDYKVAYAFAKVQSDSNQKATIMLGSDDGVKVWLNGNLVHENDVGRGLTPREDVFDIELIKGENSLLVKVGDYVRGWETIVEIFDEKGVEKINQDKRDELDFYEFMNSKLLVKDDIESSVTFYYGDKFPELKWEQPYLMEKVAGKIKLNIEWFDKGLNRVTKPEKPGTYAYYAHATTDSGYVIRRAATLYAYPYDWYGWSEAPLAELNYQPVSTLSKNKWAENQEAISFFVGRMFNRSALRQEDASVLMAFVDNQNDIEYEDKSNTPIIWNGDFHTKLKRKVLGLTNNFEKFKLPEKTNQNSVSLKEGDEHLAGFKPGLKQKLIDHCEKWFEASKEPFDMLVAKNGVVIVNLAFGEDAYGKFTTETPTEIASITKMLSGLVFAQFVEQGLADFDSYVGEFLPDFSTSDGSITLRNCFTHTTGLKGHGAFGGVQNPWMDNAIAALAPSLPVNKVHHYNGIGYNLAGKVMEIISGKSVFRLFRENLFDPLMLKNTFNEEDLAYGTHSTAYDLAVIGQMVLNRGVYNNLRFFSEETFNNLLPKPLSNWYPEINQDWGIGITWMNTKDSKTGKYLLSDKIIGHGSATSSVLQIDLENNIIITQSRRKGGSDFNQYFNEMLSIIDKHLIK